jgi:hypothetical protein
VSFIHSLSLTLAFTLAHASALGPACDLIQLNAARDAEAAARAIPPDDLELKYLEDGVVTGLPRDNWGVTRITLARRDRAESRVYLISARQVDDSPTCRVVTARLIADHAPIPDRRALADRLSGHDPSHGLLRALELIDLDFPELTNPRERANVEVIEGDATAAIGRPVTLKYEFGWGDCLAGCTDERTVIIRYTRGLTSPAIEVLSESGSAFP